MDPSEFGLPTSTRRRVPGLRREEVAQLASISHDYYARLEQGRIAPSLSVLNALCDVLRLDGDQRDYLSDLAGKSVMGPQGLPSGRIRPELQRLLDAMTGIPAFIFDQRLDILAWNSLAAAVYVDFGRVAEEHRNYVSLMFTDTEFRPRYDDWDSAARDAVATLRRSAAHSPDDPRLTELIEELREQSSEFRTWWAAHEVVDSSSGTTVMRHPIAGELTLDWNTFASDNDDGQRLTTMTAPLHSPTDQALRFLTSWDDSTVHPT